MNKMAPPLKAIGSEADGAPAELADTRSFKSAMSGPHADAVSCAA